MVDFSKFRKAGGKFHDQDFTMTNTRWDEITATSGFVGIYFVSDLEGADGQTQEKKWLLGDAEKLRAKLRVTDDNTLEDVDDDKPYEATDSDETQWLFNSMMEAGVQAKVLQQIGGNPGIIDGYTFHLVEKPTGKKQKKNGVETQYDQTRLVVDADGLVSSPNDKGKGGKAAVGASKPASKPTSKPAPTAAVDDDDDVDDDSGSELSPVDAASVATIQQVLSAPKKYVANFNAKANGGGVTLAQMGAAALGNAIPKEHKSVSKADVSKRVRKPDLYEQFAGELWEFNSDDGIVSAIG